MKRGPCQNIVVGPQSPLTGGGAVRPGTKLVVVQDLDNFKSNAKGADVRSTEAVPTGMAVL